MDYRYAFTRQLFDFFVKAQNGRAGSLRPGRLLEAALFQKGQAERRRRAERGAEAQGESLAVPPILIASLTRRCNLDCVGCYSKALRPSDAGQEELSDDRFMELFREALELGVSAILLAGGEPLLRKPLVEEAARLPGVLLPLFTNGTLLDDAFLDRVRDSSLVPILSIEGEGPDTDGRRGRGIHASVLSRMDAMRERGMLFGASVTLSSANADLVLSRPYLEALAEAGIGVLFLIEYVPAQSGTRHLVLEARQKTALDSKEAFEGLPFPVVALPGDEAAFGGCLAAGRGFVHLAAEGNLEACPFAPFSDTNAGLNGLRAALGSPLMKAIRERHAELTESSGGCALWDKSGWVAGLGTCSGVNGFAAGSGVNGFAAGDRGGDEAGRPALHEAALASL